MTQNNEYLMLVRKPTGVLLTINTKMIQTTTREYSTKSILFQKYVLNMLL